MSIPSSGEGSSHFPFEPRRAEREQKEGVAEREQKEGVAEMDQKEGAAEGDQKEGVSRVYRIAVPSAVLEQGIAAVKRAKYRYRSVTDEQRAKDEQIAEQVEVKARGVRDHIDGKAEADGKAAAPGEREVKAAPPPAAALPPAGPRAPRPKYRLAMGGAKAVALAPAQQEGIVVVHRVLPDPRRDDATWANVNIDIGPEKREAVIAETEKFAIKKAEEDKKKLDEAGQKGEKEVKAGAAGEVAIPTIAKEPPTPVEKLEKSGIEFKPEINAIKQDDGNIVCTVSLEATVPEETANKLPNFILKLIDNSGSMDDPSTVVGKTRKQLAIDSAKAIIEAAKPEDRICIILWDSDAKMLFPPCHPTEANKKIMFDLLDHYKTGGSTQMLPAVSHGLALVSVEQLAGSKEKPQIFFLTDGENNTTDIDLGAERFAAQFKASGIKNATLHAIPVGTNPSAPTMSAFSTAIGGGSSFIDSTKGVLKDVMSHTLKNAPKPPITSDSVAEITAPEGYQIRGIRYGG